MAYTATVDELIKAQSAANKTANTATTQNNTEVTPAVTAPTSPTTTAPAVDASANAVTSAPKTYNGTEGENRINQMFDAQKEAQLGSLKTAYDKSMSAAQQAKDKIAPQYHVSANDLAVQYERNRRNFNQQAAANGLNTGTASQASLAQNNEYLRDFGKLRTSESEALTAADKGMADLTFEYENNIKSAIADNDYKRMAALLDQYNADRKEALAKAEVLASYGDFSGYADIYGSATANKMKKSWIVSNPGMAFMTGAINENQYNNLINGYPMNYVADYGGSSGGNDPWAYGGSGWNSYSQLEVGGLSPAEWKARNG